MILAAGLGTRLRPITDRVPKPLLPVGLETALGRWVRWLGAHGIREVVVNLHHLGDQIRRQVQADGSGAVSILWSEEPEILGTGGGLRQALAALGSEPILLVNADVVAEPDLEAMFEVHRRLGADATMLLRLDRDAARFGSVEVDAAGRVRRLLGVPAGAPGPLESCIFTGVQIVDPGAARLLPERGCIVRTMLRRLVDGEGIVGGALHGGPWFDIGSLRGYLDANLSLAGEGVLSAESATVAPGATVGPSVVLGALSRVQSGAAVRRAVVWPGTTVPPGVFEDSIVTPFGVFGVTPASPASAQESR